MCHDRALERAYKSECNIDFNCDYQFRIDKPPENTKFDNKRSVFVKGFNSVISES